MQTSNFARQIQGFDPQVHMKKEIELKFKIEKPNLI
jgi:hypothetical protein